MKLATIDQGGRDGTLVVVSRDLSTAVAASSLAQTLQDALEHWNEVERGLLELAASLEKGTAARSFAFDSVHALAPLPRAWQWLDGSAFPAHGALMDQVMGFKPAKMDVPLMYQGLSHQFLAPDETALFPSEADGIDFEGEFGIITDDVPMGVSPADAAQHIKLIVQINDWSLRVAGMREMKTGFGWIQGKPASSMAPVAVTPDELGDTWARARVHLPLHVTWNGTLFGAANGSAMAFGFDELIAHGARTRSLCAGTVIGSGTVSNENYREIGSSCIAERRGIEVIDFGAARTAFMRYGDRVRMEARSADGSPLFGAIDQTVAALLR